MSYFGDFYIYCQYRQIKIPAKYKCFTVQCTCTSSVLTTSLLCLTIFHLVYINLIYFVTKGFSMFLMQYCPNLLSNNSLLKYFISIYSLPSNCCLKIYSIFSLIGNSRDRSFYYKLSVFQIKGSLSINNVWVLNRENLSLVFVNNKGTDQPAHQCRLISTLLGAHITPK